MTVRQISAITLAVTDMAVSVNFYRDKIGLLLLHGGETESFSSFRVGDGYLNLTSMPEGGWSWWGRLIFYVDDVDDMYERLIGAGLTIDQFREYPFVTYKARQGMVQGEDGLWRLPPEVIPLPLMFTLTASKPGA